AHASAISTTSVAMELSDAPSRRRARRVVAARGSRRGVHIPYGALARREELTASPCTDVNAAAVCSVIATDRIRSPYPSLLPVHSAHEMPRVRGISVEPALQ
ncbi:MAG TPA: hypothetical protein VN889_02390, partial [Solirubrobacteraceae bacterium]|nr:hypothetical protein [Solirubrobacteraceae bacterium]